MKQEKKEKCFIFHLNEEIHQMIKIRAAMRNISMKQWVIKAILENIRREDQYN